MLIVRKHTKRWGIQPAILLEDLYINENHPRRYYIDALGTSWPAIETSTNTYKHSVPDKSILRIYEITPTIRLCPVLSASSTQCS
jgi:hypothetical protein